MPWDSGVGEYDTSIRDALLSERKSRAGGRPVPPEPVLATLNPSIVTGTLPVGTPLIETSRALPALYTILIPGRYFRNSPGLLSAVLPNSSVETTFLMF